MHYAMALLYDVIADLPEDITVTPVFAADKAQALKAARELVPWASGHNRDQGRRTRDVVDQAIAAWLDQQAA